VWLREEADRRATEAASAAEAKRAAALAQAVAAVVACEGETTGEAGWQPGFGLGFVWLPGSDLEARARRRVAARLEPALTAVGLGFGRIVALHHRSSTLYKVREENRFSS
jgi:hypothetical protein